VRPPGHEPAPLPPRRPGDEQRERLYLAEHWTFSTPSVPARVPNPLPVPSRRLARTLVLARAPLPWRDVVTLVQALAVCTGVEAPIAVRRGRSGVDVARGGWDSAGLFVCIPPPSRCRAAVAHEFVHALVEHRFGRGRCAWHGAEFASGLLATASQLFGRLVAARLNVGYARAGVRMSG
jgi:hypothetical protein